MLKPTVLRCCQMLTNQVSRSFLQKSTRSLSSFRVRNRRQSLPCSVIQEQVTFSSMRLPTLTQTASYCSNNSTGCGVDQKCKTRKCDILYEELAKSVDEGTVQLFDVREPKELEKTGKIPSATNIPLQQLKVSLSSTSEEFLVRYGVQQPSKADTNIVFYGLCHVKGCTALELAHKQGYKKAKHFPGGMEEWLRREGRLASTVSES